MRSVVLVVMDGFGMAPAGPGNAISLAKPPNLLNYLYSYPNTTLRASGEAVGLPRGEVGNTEVGHINLGAGRIVYQDLPRINMSVADGSFYKNEALQKAIAHINQTHGKLHFIGLIGTGTVHSNIDHLFALMKFASDNGHKNPYLHVITDGRDSPPKSAIDILKQLEERQKQIDHCTCQIASVSGRYFAMDRDRRWERTEKAYLALTKGEGKKANSIYEAIESSYSEGKTDEFIEPTNIVNNGSPIALVEKGDAIVFFNYRIDRPRQLTKAFVLDDFENKANLIGSYDPFEVKYHKTHLHYNRTEEAPNAPFARGGKIENLLFITMTDYEKGLPVEIAYPQIIVPMPLARVLSEHNVLQLHMSESEKERFVTFYFDGQRDRPFPQEETLIIPSPKVATYDLKPEMSAIEMTDELEKMIYADTYKFILINYANPDMVGHTGSIEASVKAIQVVDTCIARIVKAALSNHTTVFITADHGNVEQKINPSTGQISTEHTDNPVPFIAVKKEFQGKLTKLQSGILADVATTVLAEMGIPKPPDMTGRNLLEEIR